VPGKHALKIFAVTWVQKGCIFFLICESLRLLPLPHSPSSSHALTHTHIQQMHKLFKHAGGRNTPSAEHNKPLPEPVVDPDEGKTPIGTASVLCFAIIVLLCFSVTAPPTRSMTLTSVV
jgi:hypothetical protein